MKRKFFVLFAVIAMAVGLSATAHAGSVSGTSTVTINFAGACTIAAANPNLDFVGADMSGSADVTVNCSNGLPWSLTANGGLNASGETRRGKQGAAFVTYRLFKDAGLSQEVGVTTANTLATGTGNGANQIATAYFAVKSADNLSNPTVGAYPDTLGWTLTF